VAGGKFGSGMHPSKFMGRFMLDHTYMHAITKKLMLNFEVFVHIAWLILTD
jgi:hypothetical protein